MLERTFRLRQNNTDVRTEVTAGMTTFAAMAYIVILNPGILSEAGMSWDGVYIATILAIVFGTLVMAFSTNYPLVLAPAMGLSAVFTYTIVEGVGAAWQTALGLVFFSGLLFLALSLSRYRLAVITMIPLSLRAAVTAGFGLLIAFTGLGSAGFVVQDPDTLVALGDATNPHTIVAGFGLLVGVVFYTFRVKGALLWSMLGAAALGLHPRLAVTPDYSGWFAVPAWDALASVALQLDIAGALQFRLAGVILALLIVDLMSTIGTAAGVTTYAGFWDKDRGLPNADNVLLSDAAATAGGALLGASTTTTAVESAVGAAEGGRTGLTAVVCAGLFLLALFLMPLVRMVPRVAVAPALIIVGTLMMRHVRQVDWDDFTEAVPAFLCMAVIPFSFSISHGLAVGFITYSALNILVGRADRTNWIVNSLSVVLLLYLIFLYPF